MKCTLFKTIADAMHMPAVNSGNQWFRFAAPMGHISRSFDLLRWLVLNPD